MGTRRERPPTDFIPVDDISGQSGIGPEGAEVDDGTPLGEVDDLVSSPLSGRDRVMLRVGAYLVGPFAFRQGQIGGRFRLPILKTPNRKALDEAAGYLGDQELGYPLDEAVAHYSSNYGSRSQKAAARRRQNTGERGGPGGPFTTLDRWRSKMPRPLIPLFDLYATRNSVKDGSLNMNDWTSNNLRADRMSAGWHLARKPLVVLGVVALGFIGGCRTKSWLDSGQVEPNDPNVAAATLAAAWLDNTTGLRTPPDQPMVFQPGTNYLDLSIRGPEAGGFPVGTLGAPAVAFGMRLPQEDGETSKAWLPPLPKDSKEGSQWAIADLTLGGKPTPVAFMVPPLPEGVNPAISGVVKDCREGGQLVFFPGTKSSEDGLEVGALREVTPDQAAGISDGKIDPKPKKECD
jgi:hypothetical protein